MTMKRLIIPTLLSLIVVACSGTSDSGSPSGQVESTPGGTSSSTLGQSAAIESAVPSADAIKVDDMTLVYLPDQVGGNFHTLTVILENTSDEVAIDVTGQVSILDGNNLLETVNPIPVNILQGEHGIWNELLDLPSPVQRAKLEVQISVGRFAPGPDESPVSFSHLRYRPNDLQGCLISGTVSNTFSEQKTDLQLRTAWFAGNDLISSGFTYVDTVFPATDATFEISTFSDAECSPDVSMILATANLGDDKIFNP